MRSNTILNVSATTASARGSGRISVLVFVLLVSFAGGAQAQSTASILPLDDFSPGFLGMYRKVMRIEDDIRRYSEEYGVDFDLTRAVCLYESGGDAGLTSGPGARGYFQVMPSTYRALGVSSNIEAGVKYLSQMVRQFEREDRAVAAYNAGPGRIDRGGAIPLETLQYVLGVGQYRAVLKVHDASIRFHASQIQLATVPEGVDWAEMSDRLALPEWELRMHNPFLATGRLRAGQVIAYPPEHRPELLRAVPGGAEYRVRHGDNYLILAFSLGVEPDELRGANNLWQIQSVPVGMSLHFPLASNQLELVRVAAEVPASAPQVDLATPSPILQLPVRRPAVVASSRRAPARVAPGPVTHRVSRGDTLASIARRYDSTIRAIQQVNRMGRRTTIRAGQRLRIPPTDAVRASN